MTGYLLRLAWPARGRVALASVALAATLASGLGLLAASGYLISKAALRPPVLDLAVAIAAVRAFALGRPVFRYLERLVSHDLALRQLARLRVKLFELIHPLAPAGLGEFRSAELLQRLVGDVEALQDLFVRVLTPPLAAGLVLALALAFVWPLAPAAAGVLLGLAAVAGVGLPLLGREGTRWAAGERASGRGELETQLVELLQGAAEIAAFGRARHRLDQLTVTDRRLAAAQGRLVSADAVTGGAGIALSGVAVAAVVWLAAPLVVGGSLDGTMLAALALTALAAFEAVQLLPTALQKVEESVASGRRLREVETAPAPVGDPAVPRAMPSGPLTLGLENAWLRYQPDGAWALAGVDLRLEPGRRVALVGPSGCGKTTLALALTRFRALDRGRASLNGLDLAEYRQDDVRRAIGLCSQDAHMFDTTIAANIRLGRPDASMTELRKAARRAHLLDWIESLPAGFETRVGEAGGAISGGQRKRIAIARTLLMDFEVVILDEPTANLDEPTAAALMRDAWDSLAGRTVLLITHRLEGLDCVDEVVVMDAGRVVERGAPAQLAREDGRFAAIAALAG